MKKILMFICVIFLLSGCSAKEKYTATYFDLFDTVVTISGYETTSSEFQETAKKLHDEMLRCHQLFDIYAEYPGVNNIKTINDHAGNSPVVVDPVIIDLLLDCKEYYQLTSGKVNVGMGSVLSLWHDSRSAASEGKPYIPDREQIVNALLHCDINNIIIDSENLTVFIQDKDQRIDVGAVAKGWTAQRISESLPEGYLLDLGGNVCATGEKPDGTPWMIGIQNPDGDGYLDTYPLTKGSAVTSGDYFRFFLHNGIRYHHLIDPETGFPADYHRSVSIFCQDSGLADCLSTALFLMPTEEGLSLLHSVSAEAIWIEPDGAKLTSTDLS